MNGFSRLLFRAAILAAVLVTFLWPALINRSPFYYPDTRTYMRGADSIMHKYLHLDSAWTGTETATDHTQSATSSADDALHNLGEARTRSLQQIGKKGVLAGRSPFYGILLYIGNLAGGFWLTSLVQAASILLAVFLLLRGLDIPVWPTLPLLGLGLCLFSDAPFFACFLMPDLFAGISILVCAVQISVDQRLRFRDYLLWFILLGAAVLFHDSCTLIAFSMLGLALLSNLLRSSWRNFYGLSIIFIAILLAFAGQSIVSYGIRKATGEVPLRLPFLSARLIADGPGARYLRANCPQSGFLLCEYRDEFPLTSDQFLFGTSPGRAVFELADYDRRRALSAEQMRFVLAVVRYDPLGVLQSGIKNAAQQMLDFRLAEFRYLPGIRDIFDRTLPLQVEPQVHASRAYQGTLPTDTFGFILYLFVAASLIYLVLAICGRLPNRSLNPTVKRIICWVLVGITVNAILCGGISVVLPRFQARVVWLFPLLVLLVEAHARFGADFLSRPGCRKQRPLAQCESGGGVY